MTNVQCDDCKRNFDINLKEKKHGNGIVEAFFTCPHCDKRYTAFVTDAVVRRKQREIRNISETLKGVTSIEEYQSIQREIEEKKQELKPLMSALKGKYGKG